MDPEDIPEDTLAKLSNSGYEVNMNQYVTVDEDLECSEPLTDDTIVTLVQQTQQDSGSENDDDDDEPLDPPSHLEAIEMVQKLRQYFESQLDSTKFFVYLNSFEEHIRSAQQNVLQQMSITHFTVK